MVTTSPVLLLTCQVCGWRPSLEEGDDPGFIKQHFDDEHAGAPVWMGIVAYCPRHDHPLTHRMTGVTRTGRNVTTYDCPIDHRTYRVKWSPDDL